MGLCVGVMHHVCPSTECESSSHLVVHGGALGHHGQMVIAWRRKGSHKVSPLTVVQGRGRLDGRGSDGCHRMMVLLMATVGLKFRAWYAQLFDLRQIGLHVVRRSPVDV